MSLYPFLVLDVRPRLVRDQRVSSDLMQFDDLVDMAWYVNRKTLVDSDVAD